jgi:hypothetical protein
MSNLMEKPPRIEPIFFRVRPMKHKQISSSMYVLMDSQIGYYLLPSPKYDTENISG